MAARRKPPASGNGPRPPRRSRNVQGAMSWRLLLGLLLLLALLWAVNHYTRSPQSLAEKAGKATRDVVTEVEEKASEVVKPKKAPKEKSSQGYDFTKAPGFPYPEGTMRGNAIVRHTYYTLAYDEAREAPQWVAYELKGDMVVGSADREDLKFKQDPLVKTESADPRAYTRSGFSRGHMAPAADFKWNQKAMEETFYTSNICPQLQAHNGGIWEDIERATRNWARREKRVFVVTGPIFDKDRTTIGNENPIEIPDKFFKVILDADGDNRKAIGFITPHEDLRGDIYQWAVSIDEVEKATGLDFWPLIPDPIEAELERTVDVSAWRKAVPVQ